MRTFLATDQSKVPPDDFSEALRPTGAVANSLPGRVEGEEELGKVSVVGTVGHGAFTERL